MSKVAIGVDIGGSGCRLDLVNGQGSLLDWRQNFSISSESERQSILDCLVEKMQNLRDLALRDGYEVVGIGIGAPGPLSAEFGIILDTPNLVQLRNFPLVQALAEKLNWGLPIYLENDANVAGAGEAFAGHGRGKKRVLVSTLGTGFGHGIVVDGKIYSGAHGMAGEHAKTLVSPGCPSIEYYVSSNFISGKFCQETGSWKSAKEIDQIAHGVFDSDIVALHERSMINCQVIAKEVYAQFGMWLGYFLTFRINENDPDVFVLMGNLAKGYELFWDSMVKNLNLAQWSDDLSFEERNTKSRDLIKISELGEEAAIIGAASMVFANQAID